MSTADRETSDTTLGKALAPMREQKHPLSGFHPLLTGIDALSGRLLAISLAEKTLDVQYYLWGNDPIGDLFFARLLDAADRGVRVRLLIDDIGTRAIEEKLVFLDAHPNLELRLFNPFKNRQIRALDAWDGYRLNRRMHNKSLTADNEITILGGRNIAAEYYSANPKYNFGDIDLIGVGSIARDTADMFDLYWNNRYSIPYTQLSDAEVSASQQENFRQHLSASISALTDTAYQSAIVGGAMKLAYDNLDSFYWAPYELVFDSPEKALSDKPENQRRLTTSLRAVVDNAEQELLIISPYFVPRKEGIEWLSGILERGTQVDVLTNGLAANDHLLVYGGYAPARKPLLKKGARFFEVRGDLTVEGTTESGASEASSKLHGKAFVVDRRSAFVGSFNWDPRSVNLNTEMGVLIHSEEIATRMAKSVYDAAGENTYAVSLLHGGNLQWETSQNGSPIYFDKEPETTWWGRLKANFTRLLPIRGQL